MQRLAAEKIHRPDGFQKQHGGGGHAPADNGVRGALEQRDICRRKRFGWRRRKGPLELRTETTELL